jgi:hypothetical protein
MEIIGNQKRVLKKTETFECLICLYKCSRKYDLERHFLTKKHNLREMEIKTTQNALIRVNCEENYNCFWIL